MAGRRFTYLCTLAGCVVFYIAYQEWFSWVLLLAVAGIPWLSLLLSLPAILTFHIQPEAPSALPMGIAGEVALVGASRFPVPPFRGRLRLRRCTTGEVWQQKETTKLPSEHCGGIEVLPENVWVCDYLGLFRFRIKNVEGRTVLVRPVPAKMSAPPDLSRYLAHAWKPKPGGGYGENHELRLYRPGDSLNQLHWKLTAKTGKLILREPMEPVRGLVLLTLDIKGTPEELDRKFGRLLWLGNCLLEQNVKFELQAMTGTGIFSRSVASERDFQRAVDSLLCCPPAPEGSLRDQPIAASWHRHIGGEPDEA